MLLTTLRIHDGGANTVQLQREFYQSTVFFEAWCVGYWVMPGKGNLWEKW